MIAKVCRSLASLLLFASTICAQTSLQEPETYATTIYVTPTGTVENDGLSKANGLTLQRGLELARSALGAGHVKVIITEGIHRHPGKYLNDPNNTAKKYDFVAEVDFWESNLEPRFPGDMELHPSVPNVLTIEGENPYAAANVISGSELLEGPWTQVGGVYESVWSHDFGSLDLGNSSQWFIGLPQASLDLFNHRQLIFVNGQRLRQVFAHADLAVGSFYIDEVADKLYLYPPPNTDMAAATVESGLYEHLLDIRRKNNLILRNLTFRHAASWYSNGTASSGPAVYIGGWGDFEPSQQLIENVVVEWNGAAGLSGYFRNFTFRNVINQHNGMIGFSFGGENGLVLDCGNFGNNWKGAEANFYDDVVCGIKVGHLYDTEILRLDSSRNFGKGLWLDVYCEDVTIRDSTFNFNQQGEGIFFEIYQGGGVVENCDIAYNGSYGVLGVLSESVTLRNNRIIGNAIAQVSLKSGPARAGSLFQHEQTNEWIDPINLLNRNWVIENNTLAIDHYRQQFYANSGTEEWQVLSNSLTVSGNVYHGTTSTGFLHDTLAETPASLDAWHIREPLARLQDRDLGPEPSAALAPAALLQVWPDYAGSGPNGYQQALAIQDVVENRPAFQRNLPALESISRITQNFVQRLRAWVIIPESGTYQFFLTANAESELRFNTSGPDNALSVIASVPYPIDYPSEVRPYDFDQHPSQHSAPMQFTKGDVIYLDALANHRSPRTDLGGQRPHLSIAWSRPSVATEGYRHAREVIPAAYLNTFGLADANPANPPVGLLREFFDNLTYTGGNPPIADLTQNTNYPTAPVSSIVIADAESPLGSLSLGGTRYRGWLTPDISGEYVFWISSNGISELWLSPDANPENLSRVAYVESWASYNQWDRTAGQKSTAISLTAGQPYYIEVRHVFKYNVHLQVGWTLPGDPLTAPSEVIPASVLEPWSSPADNWRTATIATPGFSAAEALASSTQTVLSGSSVFWGTDFPGSAVLTQSAFHDGTLTVRFDSLHSAASAPVTGLFMRASLSEPDSGITLTVDLAGNLNLVSRNSFGATLTTTNLASGLSFPLYLRLYRSGNFITPAASQDNSTWTEYPSVHLSELPPTSHIGVMVDSHDPGIRAQSAFRFTDFTFISFDNFDYNSQWKAYAFANHPDGVTGDHTLISADANGDGIPNLVKFAQLRPSDASGPYHTPLEKTAFYSPDGGGYHLSLRVISNGSGDPRTGYTFAHLTYTIETSTTLEPDAWEPAGTTLLDITGSTLNPDGTESLTLTYHFANDPITPQKRFFRLKVTYAP